MGRRATAQAIGKYEPNAVPSSGVLIALAEALGVAVECLTSDQDLVLRRSSSGRRRFLANGVIHLVERYLAMGELLVLLAINWNNPREAPYPIVTILRRWSMQPQLAHPLEPRPAPDFEHDRASGG